MITHSFGRELLERYGSPLYVYDLEEAERRARTLIGLIPKSACIGCSERSFSRWYASSHGASLVRSLGGIARDRQWRKDRSRPCPAVVSGKARRLAFSGETQ